MDKRFRGIVDNGKRNLIVFGDKYPLKYFSKEYNPGYRATFTSCGTETEPGPQTLVNLINEVKIENIPIVFILNLAHKRLQIHL